MSDDASRGQPKSRQLTPLTGVVVYVSAGLLWVTLTDWLLRTTVTDLALLNLLQSLKGWLYVLATGLLLYWLIARSTARLRHTVSSLTHEMVERQQIEVALLQTDEAERQQRLLAEALRDTAEALTNTLDFDEVLDRILSNIDRVVPYDSATTQGVIEYVNPAIERLTGYSRSEVLGQTARLWKSGRTPQTVYDQMWRTIRRGEIWIGELVNRHKTGRLYDCALAIAPLREAWQSSGSKRV